MANRRLYWPLVVMVSAALVYVLAVVQRISPPVVALVVMRDLALDPGDMSLLFSVTMVCYGIMQPVAGFCADRFGPRRCLLISVIGLSLGSLIFGFAHGLPQGLLARALVGLAAGLAMMPCLKLAGHWFSASRFALASSCLVSSAAAANFLVGRPLAQAVDIFGWRYSFTGLGLMGLALTFLVLMVVRDRPPISEAGDAGAEKPEATPEPPGFLASLSRIIREPEFWLLGALYVCTDLLYATFTSLWAGPYLIEVQGQTEVAVGNMLSVAAVGFLVGPPLLVLLATVWRSYGKVLVLITLLDLMVAGLLTYGPAGLDTPILYGLCLLAPVGGQAAGLVFVLARNLFPNYLGASAMGFINIFALIPAAFMQKIMGDILAQGRRLTPDLPAQELYAQAFHPLFIIMIIGVPLALWQVRKERLGPLSRHNSN